MRPHVFSRRLAWALLLLTFAPAASLISHALAVAPPSFWSDLSMSRPFRGAVLRSAWQIGSVFLLTLAFAWPYGTALGLWAFRGRRWARLVLLLPLLVPPFLWAIGIQGWKGFVDFRTQAWFDGFSGSVLAYSVQAVPLLSLIIAGAHSLLGRSEREAVLLASGGGALFRESMRRTWALAGAGAALAATMTLADAGCGLIMGFHGLATEVHIALAARGDAALAACKALATTVLILPVALLVALAFAREVGPRVTLHDVRLGHHAGGALRAPGLAGVALWLGACLVPLAGFVGLARPLFSGRSLQFFPDAWRILVESAGATFQLAAAAAVVGVGAGFWVAISLGRGPRTLRVLIVLVLLSLILPPSLTALGVLGWQVRLPAGVDFITHTQWWVGAVCGLRWIPLAAFLLALGWRELPASALDSAQLCGVSRSYFLRRLAWPALWSRTAPLGAMAGLLALSDVSTALLLQPPGSASYGMRLFSVMDNAPDKHVATLCLVYLLWPLAIGLVASLLARLGAARRALTA